LQDSLGVGVGVEGGGGGGGGGRGGEVLETGLKLSVRDGVVLGSILGDSDIEGVSAKEADALTDSEILSVALGVVDGTTTCMVEPN